MAITRRQFVTRMGALAAAVGMSQAQISEITHAFAGNETNFGGTHGKPRVVWVHGAECTGCSTSLLSVLENANGNAVFGTSIDTGTALGLAGVTDALGNPGTTLANNSLNLDGGLISIADVVIDVVDLQYHETVMSMGGDLAANWLDQFITDDAGLFVLVVEGAVQAHGASNTGAWGDTSDTAFPWCSIGMTDQYDAETKSGGVEHDFAEVVHDLGTKNGCLAIIPIGQCACYGGYPACKPQITDATAGKNVGGFDPKLSQTGAKGVHKFLSDLGTGGDAAAAKAATKVVNVPGCPTNPWWFVLTVVAFMVDANHILKGTAGAPPLGVLKKPADPGYNGIQFNPACLDSLAQRRLKAAYPIPVHSGKCPRYQYYTAGIYALHPGERGCLQKIGCKGLSTRSLCGLHGWNNAQPENLGSATLANQYYGGHCTTAGHPCMGCTESGYPDRFVPFVKL